MTQQQQPSPGIQPSLADLDKPDEQQPTPPADPKPSAEDDLTKNPVNTPSPTDPPGDPKPDPAKPDPNKPADPKEGDEPGDDEEDDLPADPTAFWGEVSKLRGDDLSWEFPEGVDPLTPEGIHHAIKKATDRELEIFEEELMKGDSRAYAYMLHRANGGSDADFFEQKTEVLPELDVLKGSVDLQQAFYKRSLTRKGILPDQADLIIKDAIEKNKLTGLVEADHKQQSEQQKKQLEELLKLNEENQKKEERQVQQMGTTLQGMIIENKGLNITIPDAKRGGFLQFVNSMVMLDRQTGKFFINQELSQDNMAKVIESLYYMHVNGNMDDIIANRANQKNIQKIKLRMQSDKTKKSSQPDPNKRTNERPGIQPALSEL
jgi:hypothetical protein